MTDTISQAPHGAAREREAKLVKARYGKDRRFQAYGIACIGIALIALVVLLTSIIGTGLSAFYRHTVTIDINLADAGVTPDNAAKADTRVLVRDAVRDMFPSVQSRRDKKDLAKLVSVAASLELRDAFRSDPSLAADGTISITAPLGATAELYLKGQATEVVDYKGEGPLNLSINQSDSGFKPVSITAAGQLLKIVRESTRSYLEKEVRDLTTRTDRLQRILNSLQNENDRVGVANRLTLATQRLEKARAELAAINDEIVLDTDMPSFIITAGDYEIKLDKVSDVGADGTIIVGAHNVLAGNSQVADWYVTELVTPEDSRKIDDNMIMQLMHLERIGLIDSEFNLAFFQTADSRDPEVAGIWGSLTGSFLTMIVTLLLSFPVAVAAAVYLEEFAPKNKVTDIIEVNINNLAAVPSIVFGLLGLAVFLNAFGLPRSAPLVGGMVLALMTLPTIIIASRAALKAVPPSIREGAVGVGASKMQAVFDHVLPLAMPGMLTGTIIGMAQALGETAPLLLIGMNAFIADVPSGFTSPAAVLPVQIYIWADAPERGFVEKTSAAIMVLLAFLVFMNGLAIYLRKRFERRW